MLVDPVGHERAGDPVVPPRLPAHLLDPAPGDVPVVVDVVVVEDHDARDRGKQPADIRVGPRLAIEARVLLEVRHLLARRLANIPPGANEVGGERRDLVRVDLVAEQQQPVRPFELAALQLARVGPQRIDARTRNGLGRRWLRIADPAGAEGQPNVALVAARVDGGGRTAVVGRPDQPAIQAHVVGEDRGRLQILDQKKREVMTLDSERLGAVTEHFDLTRRAGLDPEARALGARVAEQRPEDELSRLRAVLRSHHNVSESVPLTEAP